MSKPKKSQVMKPATAAVKLDVYLPATPREFQEGEISREELDELQRNPPQWLSDLRRDGPHPRNVVAARLRVSNSGLARAGVTEALTTAQITALAADPPEWLVLEREKHAEALREQRRLESRRAEAEQEAAAPAKPAKPAARKSAAPKGTKKSVFNVRVSSGPRRTGSGSSRKPSSRG
ncbi:DUF5997 family protein [Catellatospora sp. KI3]|uniref:DUF5997 family protein n=1 Tax=Catellatospora sp. KI3 TaxID=3041620 RepID=UPI00248270F1|nr:DUF5997 family protein [Catellatospora sp. KI3]MDI1461322.1 DUF5997 family protein [Catellatospora sp. KI3]